jgi:hypothetical protein
MNLDRTVTQDVYWAVYLVVGRAVDWTVSGVMYQDITMAVYWAVGCSMDGVWAGDPAHPALADFLSGYADRGAP